MSETTPNSTAAVAQPAADNAAQNGGSQIPQEVLQAAAMAFGDPSILPKQEPTPSGNGAQASSPAAQAQQPATPATPATPVAATPSQPAAQPNEVVETFDENDYVKNNFGFDSAEALKAELETLQKLRQNPISFSDETAKKIYEAIAAGKHDEVYNYLHGNKLAQSLEGKSEEEKLKFYIKSQNPLFEKNDVDYKYNLLYSVNEETFKDTSGEVDQQAYRIAKLEAEQKRIADLQAAEQHFSTLKTKLELPQISQDPEYVSWKQNREKEIAEADKYNAEVKEFYSKLTPSELKQEFKLVDEANKVEIETAFEPDGESFSNAIATVSDIEKFFKQYQAADGSPLRKEFLQDFYFARNRGKIISQVMQDTVNAMLRWMINKPSGSAGGQRQYTTGSDNGSGLPDDIKKAWGDGLFR